MPANLVIQIYHVLDSENIYYVMLFFILVKVKETSIHLSTASSQMPTASSLMLRSAVLPPGQVLVTGCEKHFGCGLSELKVCYLNWTNPPLCMWIKGKTDSDYVAGSFIFSQGLLCPLVSGPLLPPLI